MARPLSLLDLTRVQQGASTNDTIRDSVTTARLAEELGYRRVWYAEHHNAPGLASGSPEVLIAHVGAQTSTIHLGAGGVMLPNHAPLRIAEAFHLLESLYPGRIDLGLGRAPGTDQRTSLALRRDPEALMADDYPERLAELMAYEEGTFPPTHPFSTISPIPADVALPPIWLLGSSDFSGILAAREGLGFSFAAHINRPAAVPVMRAYRERFTSNGRFSAPNAILAVSVILAETDEAAEDLMSIVRVNMYRLVTGTGMGPSLPLEEARAFPIPPDALIRIGGMLANQFVGTPDRVAAEVKSLADDAGADEVMITTQIPMMDNREFVLREFQRAWKQIDASS